MRKSVTEYFKWWMNFYKISVSAQETVFQKLNEIFEVLDSEQNTNVATEWKQLRKKQTVKND